MADRDNIIRMAREAGMDAMVGTTRAGKYEPKVAALKRSVPVEWLESFAELVKADFLQRTGREQRGAPAAVPATNIPLRSPDCWCETCDLAANAGFRSRMSLCPTCGNKRCPRATYHDHACTGSNAPGQKGSSWENVKLAAGARGQHG